MTETRPPTDAPAPADDPYAGWRVRPSIPIAIGIYLGYLAVFYTTWAVNDVDYPDIGKTVSSTKLHYAMPTLLGCVFLLIAVTALGWWRPTLFDKSRNGPSWAWIGPIVMFGLSIATLASLNGGHWSNELILWSVLGGIGVGIGEETITRGTMVVGLRTKYPELKVWLYSTLLFSALHFPNVFFGLAAPKMIVQLLFTFIMGSLFYALRRLSGTLILCILLHGLWDSSIFLPRATGASANLLTFIIWPVAIAVTWAVVRRNAGKHIEP